MIRGRVSRACESVKQRRYLVRSLPLLVGLALVFSPLASAGTIDFEGLADSTDIGATYSGLGVVFTNALAISAGINLNELEFPPDSGVNVATDSPGPMALQFSTPVMSFEGFFTYATSLSLVGTLSGSTVATASSAFSSNYVSSGNPPNELLQLSWAGGIDMITITGDPNGGSFVVDDVTFQTGGSPASVPEPATWSLLGGALLGGAVWRRNRARA